VDARDRVVGGIRDPDAPLPHSDLERDRADTDRRKDRAARRIDPRDRPSLRVDVRVDHPERSLTGRDADRVGADLDGRLDLGVVGTGGADRVGGPGGSDIAFDRGVATPARREDEEARERERGQAWSPSLHRHPIRAASVAETGSGTAGQETATQSHSTKPILAPMTEAEGARALFKQIADRVDERSFGVT